MRLTTLNLVKRYFNEKIAEVKGTEDEATPELINGLIKQLAEYDYANDEHGMAEHCPEEYREEIVAWLREEYL